MNNLKIKNISHHAFSIPNVDQAVYVEHLLFLRAGPSVYLYRELDEWITIAHRIDHIEYHSILNALVARNSREIIIVDLATKKEVIISLPNEYIAQKWNPTQDRFVFVDDEMNLHLAYVDMQKQECVVIQVYNLLQKTTNSFVNVGWGSEKTQFRGSEGKKKGENSKGKQNVKVDTDDRQDAKEKEGKREVPMEEEKKDKPVIVMSKEKDGEQEVAKAEEKQTEQVVVMVKEKEDEQDVAKAEEKLDEQVVVMTKEKEDEQEVVKSEEKQDKPEVVMAKEKTDKQEVTTCNAESITPEMIRDTAEQNRELNSIQIVWCEMGNIFTVSYIFQGVRYYKSFDNDLNFLNELESKPGMGKNMAWRPDGSYLAVECNDKDRKILFFEKSGLYYREQKVLYPDPIRHISWNADQSLLLIWQDNEEKTTVTLWAAYTSTWIMKQCLMFDHSDNRVNNVSWFNDNIEVITDKYLYVYSFIFEQDRTSCLTVADARTDDSIIQAVALVDGLYLNISIFEKHILPPPLYSYQIKMNRPMRQVIFGINTNTIAVIFHDFSVRVYEFNQTSYNEIENHGSVVPSKTFLCYNFVYDDLNMQILSCGRTPDTAKQIVTYNMLTEELTFSHELDKEERFNFPEKYFDLVPVVTSEKDSFYFALLRDCNFIIYQNFEGHSTRFIENEYVWSYCFDKNKGNVYIARVNNILYSFYKEDSKLYLNGIKIHNKVTSMIFDQEFLLLTTMNDTLIAVTVTQESLELMQKGDFSSFFTRNIAPNAVILCLIPAERQVVLYLTNRDETEVITPRIMSISKIDKLLDEKKYISACRIARSDRINPNVFYDMKPKRFINNVKEFIESIFYVDMIDQFLLSLENDDNITCNVYGYVVGDEWKFADNDLPKKRRISNCMVSTMKTIDQPYYLQSIVTAYHILGTIDGLKLALIELFQAKMLHEKGTEQYRKTPSAILQHVLTLAHFDPLYEAALILDKTEITKWLLSLSHIDPLEYMPFLKEIETLPSNYRKYLIYMKVKDFEDALKFLLRSELIPGVDIVSLIKQLLKKHNLYYLVIQYIERVSPYYIDIMLYYAQHMCEQDRPNEAGVIFFNLGKDYYIDAFQCFCKATNTKEAIIVAKLINKEPELRKSFLDLAKTLVSLKRLQEAANIYDQVLNNPEMAFATFVSGEHWSEANYLATKFHRQDLISSIMIPSLAKAAKDYITNLKNIKKEFNRVYSRLEKLREEKIELCKTLGISEVYKTQNKATAEMLDIADGLETASITSKQSLLGPASELSFISTSTTRRKKKLERKLVSTKEGSAYEIVGLLTSLYNQIDGVHKSIESISNCCNYLFMFPDQICMGLKLQKAFDELWDDIQITRPKIWTTDITEVNLNKDRELSPTRVVHRLHLEHINYKFHHPPPDPTIQWKPLFK